jgi:hypothetical protein
VGGAYTIVGEGKEGGKRKGRKEKERKKST